MDGPSPFRRDDYSQPQPASPPPQGDRKAGGIAGVLAGIGLLIAKFFAYIKFLLIPLAKAGPIILKSGGSMILMVGVYWSIWGWQWAVGFVLLLFVHETGHLLAARAFGLKVGPPIFIPFMGAFIALKEAPRDAWIEAWIGISGPLLGSAGALVCHAAGEQFEIPLLIGLASTGYWLNLFNLIPVGQLDGGHVAQALSPWLWVPGIGIMGWFAWSHPNFIVILILLSSIPRIISLFRKKTADDLRFYEVSPSRRLAMAGMYFGLIGALVFGMYVAQEQLRGRGIHEGSRRVQVQ